MWSNVCFAQYKAGLHVSVASPITFALAVRVSRNICFSLTTAFQKPFTSFLLGFHRTEIHRQFRVSLTTGTFCLLIRELNPRFPFVRYTDENICLYRLTQIGACKTRVAPGLQVCAIHIDALQKKVVARKWCIHSSPLVWKNCKNFRLICWF